MKTTLTISTKRTTITDNNTFRVCSATATVKSATEICFAYYSDSKQVNKFCEYGEREDGPPSPIMESDYS